MWTVSGQRPYRYAIRKVPHLFFVSNPALVDIAHLSPGGRCHLVVDDAVHRMYGERIERYFASYNIGVHTSVVPSGDAAKHLGTFQRLFLDLCAADVGRRGHPIIAVGGGTVTDIAGFAASTYRRGIPHIKVPTTLVGYIDAALGIKTGVNVGPHKNRMGTFFVPSAVLLDVSFLATLETEQVLDGVGEIAKLAIARDRGLFSMLEHGGRTAIERRFQDTVGLAMLDRSIALALETLSENLFEDDLTRVMDFGETFSLAIEASSGYAVSHGRAVALDIFLSCCLAAHRGLLSRDELDRIHALYGTLGLPVELGGVDTVALHHSVRERTLHRGGQQLIAVPLSIGSSVFLNDVTLEDIEAARRVHAEYAGV